MSNRYMQNTITKVILPFRARIASQSHFVECTKDGIKIGKDPDAVDEMSELVKRQEKELEALRNSVRNLRASIAKYENNKKNNEFKAKDGNRRVDLRNKPREELLAIARGLEMKMAAAHFPKGNEEKLIEAIIAKESSLKKSE